MEAYIDFGEDDNLEDGVLEQGGPTPGSKMETVASSASKGPPHFLPSLPAFPHPQRTAKCRGWWWRWTRIYEMPGEGSGSAQGHTSWSLDPPMPAKAAW